THAVLARHRTGHTPIALAVSEASNRVYAAIRNHNHVAVFDGATNALLDTVPVGAGPYTLRHNAANDRVYVANYGDSTVSVIDCATNTVSATVVVGRYPIRLAVNSPGNRVYVGTNASELVVLDGAGDSVLARVPMSSSADGIGYSPRSDLAYVGMPGRIVTVVDCKTNTVRHTVPAGNRCDVFALGQERVYALSWYASSISVISDTLTGVAEPGRPDTRRTAGATIVRGVLHLGAGHNPILPGKSGLCPKPALLDISGRKVMELAPGDNDVSRLSPGVYFIRAEGQRGQGVEDSSAKVIIQK
ncbi:MAG: hypothetical protein R6X14_07705, partial [bacterium]